MAYFASREPNLDYQCDRFAIVREARVPTTYTDGRGVEHSVSAGTVKLVLLDLAEFGGPNNDLHKGLKNLIHHTQLSRSDVDRAIRVLLQAGWIARRSRGLGKTKGTVIDWAIVQAAREQPVYDAIESADQESEPLAPTPDAQPVSDAEFGDALPDAGASPSVDFFAGCAHISTLPRPDLQFFSQKMESGPDVFLRFAAVGRMTNDQWRKIAEAKNPRAYFLTTLSQEVEKLRVELDDERKRHTRAEMDEACRWLATEKSNVLSIGVDSYMLAVARHTLQRVAAESPDTPITRYILYRAKPDLAVAINLEFSGVPQFSAPDPEPQFRRKADAEPEAVDYDARMLDDWVEIDPEILREAEMRHRNYRA